MIFCWLLYQPVSLNQSCGLHTQTALGPLNGCLYFVGIISLVIAAWSLIPTVILGAIIGWIIGKIKKSRLFVEGFLTWRKTAKK